MERKVKVRYKIVTSNYYKPVLYKTKTFKLRLPTDKLGFILHDTLTDILFELLKKIVFSEMQTVKYFDIIWWQVVDERIKG